MNVSFLIVNESNGWRKYVALRGRNSLWFRLRHVLFLLSCSISASSCLEFGILSVSEPNIRSSLLTLHNYMDNNSRTRFTGHSIENFRRTIYFLCFGSHNKETECLVLRSKTFVFSFGREDRPKVQFCELKHACLFPNQDDSTLRFYTGHHVLHLYEFWTRF